MIRSRLATLRARLARLDTAPLLAFAAPAVLLLAFLKLASEMSLVY